MTRTMETKEMATEYSGLQLIRGALLVRKDGKLHTGCIMTTGELPVDECDVLSEFVVDDSGDGWEQCYFATIVARPEILKKYNRCGWLAICKDCGSYVDSTCDKHCTCRYDPVVENGEVIRFDERTAR